MPAYYAEMRTYRNAHILQDAVVLLDRGVIDWNARIVDGFMHYAVKGPSAESHLKLYTAFAQLRSPVASTS